MDQFISLRSIYSLNSYKEVLFDKSVIFWDNLYLPIHDFSINFAFLVILRLIMLSVYHFDPFCWIGCFIFPVIKCKLHCDLSHFWEIKYNSAFYFNKDLISSFSAASRYEDPSGAVPDFDAP